VSRQPHRAARALLHRCGVEAAEHIQVEAIARSLGAYVIDDPTLVTSDARLLRTRHHTVIRLSVRRLKSPGRRRFSLAHELGHLVLGSGLNTVSLLSCSSAADPEAHDREADADAFAAELLMPEALVRRRCEVSPMSLDVAQAIAETFGTSLVASAIRLAELTSERCATVYSEDGIVRWSARSSSFHAVVERGAPLDPLSVAFDLARGLRHHDRGARPILADAWIDTPGSGELVEHSVMVPETGGVLTLLWVPDGESRRVGMRAG
jgi:Zn-dependent peptidase ImmA (M78 family)